MAAFRDGGRDQGRRPRRDSERPAASAALLDPRERPANVDAERAVLGSILLKPDVCDDVALVLRPEDFSDESHQLLYRHLLDLHDTGKRIDATIGSGSYSTSTGDQEIPFLADSPPPGGSGTGDFGGALRTTRAPPTKMVFVSGLEAGLPCAPDPRHSCRTAER